MLSVNDQIAKTLDSVLYRVTDSDGSSTILTAQDFDIFISDTCDVNTDVTLTFRKVMLSDLTGMEVEQLIAEIKANADIRV